MRLYGSIFIALAIVAALISVAPEFNREVSARQRYNRAVGDYMLGEVSKCESTLAAIADMYPDLPIGAMAELKRGFIIYDSYGERQRAEMIFRGFLDEHPNGVMYVADDPTPEYEGELELVAYYFLGRIARERGNSSEAKFWLDKIASVGSRNPANIVVGEATILLRQIKTETGADGDENE